jgi:cyclophilin family peptidyl-prolyl cis-trans isomerase
VSIPLAVGLALFLSILCGPARAAAPDLSRPSKERVILHTMAGDMVLVLYPEAAPQTVQQFLRLVRAGVYDTTAFVRIEPGFVAQVSTAADRTRPFTPEQKALIHKLPAEFNDLKHQRGSLSMAREDGDPNSAETSFSILLSAAPHLDNKYTVFGKVEAGYGVLDEMLKVPRDGTRPETRLEIQSATVVPSAEALEQLVVQRPHALPFVNQVRRPARQPPSTAAGTEGPPALPLAGGVGFIVFLGLASFLLQGRVPGSVHMSLNLGMVLVGAFLLLTLLTPMGQHRPLLATFLFFGLIGVLKVLGRFERAMEK